jgi:hypothetical protein
MRNISFGQIIIALLLCFLLFGDLSSLKKYLKVFIEKYNLFSNENKKNRKKGS